MRTHPVDKLSCWNSIATNLLQGLLQLARFYVCDYIILFALLVKDLDDFLFIIWESKVNHDRRV